MPSDLFPPPPERDDWTGEHFPATEYVDAPKEPLEIADQLSEEARKTLVEEAAAHYRAADWRERRAKFIRKLDFLESLWFG